jgi:diguanylate cyclase (GGDEF)-like protein/PAS domain S-box-containing protein
MTQPPVPAAWPATQTVSVPLALLSLLERTTSDLITLPPDALDALIDRTLQDIGELFGVDRAYLFLASEDGSVYDNTHEWCAPGVEPQRENLRGLPTALFPWWTAQMAAGQDVVLHSLDDLPAEAASERALLEPQGIRSLLALPVRWRGRFWGLTGFDHVQRSHAWSRDQVAVLRLVVSAQGFERRRMDARLGLARTVFQQAQEGIFVTDAEQRILDVNPTFSEIVGVPAADCVGRPQQAVLPPLQDPGILETVRVLGLWRGELELNCADSQVRALRLSISAVRDGRGRPDGFVGVFSDVTRLREQERQLRQLAYHDALTHLPNRVLLADRMRQALAHARRQGGVLAVALLDLDGFKPVNDTHGHAAGDQVLVELAHRLQAVLRDGDTVARLGGDEFVLLLPGLQTPEDADILMQRVLAAVEQPLPLPGQVALRLTASIGLRTVPPLPEDADTLLRQADQALYAAKRQGRARVHRFDADDEQQALQRHARIAEVGQALARGEMVLHYQPVVDLRNGQPLRAEALVRWARPGGPLLMPGDWLPLIEHTALIAELGAWVLGTALRACADWQAVAPGLGVAVNVSARELCDPGYVQRLAQALAHHPGLPPRLLQLEVVESAPMSALPAALATMRGCRALGVDFALDDFGTGYSSLAYLKSLPVTTAKIDRSFVAQLHEADEDEPSGDQRIVQGIVALVGGCGLQAVGEGVETPQHARALVRAGCVLGQGYGILRPVPVQQLLRWVVESSKTPTVDTVTAPVTAV